MKEVWLLSRLSAESVWKPVATFRTLPDLRGYIEAAKRSGNNDIFHFEPIPFYE